MNALGRYLTLLTLVTCQAQRRSHCTKMMDTLPKSVLPLLPYLNTNRDIILGSGSPRRKELLALMGITNFRVQMSNFDENLDKKLFGSAAEYCIATSIGKGTAIANTFLRNKEDLDSILICADTVVEIDGLILEKPIDGADAERMLRLLSGREHCVHTGVSIFGAKGRDSGTRETLRLLDSFSVSTFVNFLTLTEADIEAYVLTKEPFDKAGSYGIQGFGGQFVQRISGCYFNIMGLPISALSKRLCELYHEHAL